MDISIQKFNFDKILKENKAAPKERLYKELLEEIKKLMIALQKGRKTYVSSVNCHNIISVDEADEIVQRVYTLNHELKQYIRVEYDTKSPYDMAIYRTDLSKDPKKMYQGLFLTKLSIVVEAK
jgi:hypothetical protein